MDTDDLSQETYATILLEAEKFNHDLTLQFGLLSSICQNEQDYINKSKMLINQLKNADLDQISDIFFDIIPDLSDLKGTLDKILNNISHVEKIPITNRHYDF